MTNTDQPDGEDLELSPLAQEGVELLEGIRQRGDPTTYQEVQLLLLTDTPKRSPENGPEVNHPDQTPGSPPPGLDLEGEI